MTTLTRRTWAAIATTIACLIFTGCAVTVPTDDETALRSKADSFLDQSRLDFANWQNARLADEAFPVFRPDREDVAYYEFPVIDRDTGAPAGFILMSTGGGDYKVTQWSTVGRSNVQYLSRDPAMAEVADARVYMLDFYSFAAEDQDGNLIAQLGDVRLVRSTNQWQSYKKDFARKHHDKIDDLEKDVRSIYKDLRSVPLISCSNWRYHYAGSDADQRRYHQIPANSPPNTSDCMSGCGATAWAMLFGWADFRASQNDPMWDASFGMYGGTALVAPVTMDAGIEDMTWEIRGYLDTGCVGDQGMTWPWDMENARRYLSSRSNSSPQLVVRMDATGVPTEATTNRADAVIRSGGPVVIQLGWEHYALAWGYRTRKCGPFTDHQFIINPGHGGADRWTSAKTSLAGWVKPYPDSPPPPGCPDGQKLCFRTMHGTPICVADGAQCPSHAPTSGCPGGVCCEPGLHSCRTCAQSYLECPIPE